MLNVLRGQNRLVLGGSLHWIFQKAKGRIGGRKPGLTDQAKRKAKLAAIEYTKYLQNEIGTIDDVCRIVGVSRATLYKYLRIEGINIQGRKR